MLVSRAVNTSKALQVVWFTFTFKTTYYDHDKATSTYETHKQTFVVLNPHTITVIYYHHNENKNQDNMCMGHQLITAPRAIVPSTSWNTS